MPSRHAAQLRRASAFAAALVLAGCATDASLDALAPTSPTPATTTRAAIAALAVGVRDPLQLCELDLQQPAGAAAATPSLTAATNAVNIRGTLEVCETDTYQPATNSLLVHFVGTGIASQLGRFIVVDDGIAYLSTSSGGGSVTFFAANGDSFTATETGTAVIVDGLATITDYATITGGTGRFDGATGSLTIVRRRDLSSPLSSGWFDGTITLAK
jgi:hypothetical protein